MSGDALRTSFPPIDVTAEQRHRAARTLAELVLRSDEPDKAGALREAMFACGLLIPKSRVRGVSYG